MGGTNCTPPFFLFNDCPFNRLMLLLYFLKKLLQVLLWIIFMVNFFWWFLTTSTRVVLTSLSTGHLAKGGFVLHSFYMYDDFQNVFLFPNRIKPDIVLVIPARTDVYCYYCGVMVYRPTKHHAVCDVCKQKNREKYEQLRRKKLRQIKQEINYYRYD